MPPAAKKQKASKKQKAPKAASTALVVIDPYTPTDIYMLVDRGTGKVIYIGQSIDTSRRWKEHARRAQAEADNRLKRYLKQKQRGIDLIEIRRVPELPHGVANQDADAFEAYFISIYGTAHDCCTNPDGCNMNGGNKADTVDVADIKRQLAEGYEWPEPAKAQAAARQAASVELQAARFQEAVLADLDARANDDPEHPIEGLADALSEARLVLGRMQGDGLYEHVRDVVLPAYENLQPFVNISRDGLAAELNHIKDRAKEADERLAKEIVCELAALRHVHPKKPQTDTEPKVEFPYTAKEATHKLRVVLGLVGRSAEDRLDLSPPMLQKWVRIRTWSADHGGQVPAGGASGRKLKANETFDDLEAEASLGSVISDWKKPYNLARAATTGRPFEASVYVLVRDFPELLQAIRTKDEIAADAAARRDTLIAFLKQGLAGGTEFELFPNECAAEELEKLTYITTGRTGTRLESITSYLWNFVNGNSAYFKEVLRAAADDTTKLTHKRVERLVAMHEAKAPDRKAGVQKNGVAQKQRRHAQAAAAGKSIRKRSTPKRARDDEVDGAADDDDRGTADADEATALDLDGAAPAPSASNALGADLSDEDMVE